LGFAKKRCHDADHQQGGWESHPVHSVEGEAAGQEREDMAEEAAGRGGGRRGHGRECLPRGCDWCAHGHFHCGCGLHHAHCSARAEP